VRRDRSAADLATRRHAAYLTDAGVCSRKGNAMTQTKRLAKLKADAAKWVADRDAFGDDLRASAAAGEPDVKNGDARARASNAREDKIYAEARALGVMDADFMHPVHQRATGEGTPLGSMWQGILDSCRDQIGDGNQFTANGLIEVAKAKLTGRPAPLRVVKGGRR
jgi:hypothetical protein